MPEHVIDLRSDTVTRPTPEMLRAMLAARVGDDVFGEDPTVNALQERIANLVGHEAAVFVPSGTMSNQIGVRVHCQLGDEVILETESHIYNYEQGGVAQLSGLATRTIDGQFGVIQREQIEKVVRFDDPHCVRSRLICLENTHNRGGGRIQPFPVVEEICTWAKQLGMARHLDGARLFSAVVETRVEASRWGKLFDTVSVCFSKGLGAPVGSALCGHRDLIAKALRHRKLFGGGMRQAGLLAAAAMYALDHHVDRLADDHAKARRLAEWIRKIEGLSLMPPDVETNLCIFHVAPRLGTAASLCAALKERGILMIPFGGNSIRAVTHLDVSMEDIETAGRALEEICGNRGSPRPQREASMR